MPEKEARHIFLINEDPALTGNSSISEELASAVSFAVHTQKKNIKIKEFDSFSEAEEAIKDGLKPVVIISSESTFRDMAREAHEDKERKERSQKKERPGHEDKKETPEPEDVLSSGNKFSYYDSDVKAQVILLTKKDAEAKCLYQINEIFGSTPNIFVIKRFREALFELINKDFKISGEMKHLESINNYSKANAPNRYIEIKDDAIPVSNAHRLARYVRERKWDQNDAKNKMEKIADVVSASGESKVSIYYGAGTLIDNICIKIGERGPGKVKSAGFKNEEHKLFLLERFFFALNAGAQEKIMKNFDLHVPEGVYTGMAKDKPLAEDQLDQATKKELVQRFADAIPVHETMSQKRNKMLANISVSEKKPGGGMGLS